MIENAGYASNLLRLNLCNTAQEQIIILRAIERRPKSGNTPDQIGPQQRQMGHVILRKK